MSDSLIVAVLPCRWAISLVNLALGRSVVKCTESELTEWVIYWQPPCNPWWADPLPLVACAPLRALGPHGRALRERAASFYKGTGLTNDSHEVYGFAKMSSNSPASYF